MQKKALFYLGFLILTSGLLACLFWAEKTNFRTIVLSYSMAFLGYLLALKSQHSFKNFGLLLFLGGCCVLPFPNLSDDIYRFYWDGLLSVEGISPYSYTPEQWLDLHDSPVFQSLFQNLNSPAYYTIYPPVAQLLYFVSALFSKDIQSFSWILKSIFLGFHLMGFHFFQKMQSLSIETQRRAGSWYFFNPLVLVEGIGNLHIELVMVSLLIAFYFLLTDSRYTAAAATISLSIGVKLLPLILLPFVFLRSGKPRLKWSIVAICALIFFPMLASLDIWHMGKSVDLYFRKFEFNASVYYLLRWLGQVLSGYNLILYLGPLLALTITYLILKKTWALQAHSLENHWKLGLWAFGIFLALSTTIHPWYVIPVLFYGVLNGYTFPLAWSYLIIFSYSHYDGDQNTENMLWIAFEYALVFLFYLLFDRPNKNIPG